MDPQGTPDAPACCGSRGNAAEDAHPIAADPGAAPRAARINGAERPQSSVMRPLMIKNPICMCKYIYIYIIYVYIYIYIYIILFIYVRHDIHSGSQLQLYRIIEILYDIYIYIYSYGLIY